MKKLLPLLILILMVGFFSVPKANAASLSNVKDTLTTSRPSPSSPLNADQAAGATQISIVDNGSIFLASDSAILDLDTGQTIESVNVSSMSAQISGSPNSRNIYLNSSLTNTHHKGTAVWTGITATHTIQFTVNTSIPSGGKIKITFPGAASNIASPSAATFSFNNLQTSAVKCYPTSACDSISVSAPSITLTTNATQTTGTIIYVLIGCTTQSTGACTAYAPALINPTKINSAGSSDQWRVLIETLDASDIVLDSSPIKIATIDSVQVQGIVEPSITFTITGLAHGTNITTQNASCTGADITNPGSGLDATATFVNLGGLSNGNINISAQELSVSTNAFSGYVITATSSGRFINPATGFWITDANGGDGLTANDTPAPAVLPATGNPAFGIHPCGADVASGTWANAATAFGSGAKYSNPWNTGVNGYYATLASYSQPASARKTEVEYAGTVAATTPAGTYTTVFTFVATGTF
ncbi:MAG: hypothetical protein HY344_03915 [Candidatus Levybacteria bacterium]|nr:hypothetical protein [Candidatus Levybacteria bacterium]